jgi:hypothetical protein
LQVLDDENTSIADLFAVLRQWDEVVQVSTVMGPPLRTLHLLLFAAAQHHH